MPVPFARIAGNLAPRRSILIVCEGAKTEPKYFDALVKHLRLTNITVAPARGSAPATIVADAAARKKESERRSADSGVVLPYDEVWCIFDVDEHPKLKTAFATAAANGLCIGLSNPCFEYWLVLHFERFGRTGLTRDQMCKQLRKHIPKYKKGGDYEDLVLDRISNAVQRARHILQSQWHINPKIPSEVLKCNPSTAAHLIVEQLMEMARA